MAPSTATDGWSKTPGDAGSFTGTVFSAAAVAAITAASDIPQIAVRKRLMAPPRIVKFGGSFYSPVPPLYSFSGPDPDGVDRPDRAGDLSGGTHVERGSPGVHEVTDPRLLVQVGKEHAHVPDLLDLLEGLLLPELDDLGGSRLADLPGVRRILAGGEGHQDLLRGRVEVDLPRGVDGDERPKLLEHLRGHAPDEAKFVDGVEEVVLRLVGKRQGKIVGALGAPHAGRVVFPQGEERLLRH